MTTDSLCLPDDPGCVELVAVDPGADWMLAVPWIAIVLAAFAVWLTVRFIRHGRRGPALAPGIIAVAVGLPFLTAPPAFSVGWFAYAPLSGLTFPPPVDTWAVAGIILQVGGVFALGLALGSRFRDPS